VLFGPAYYFHNLHQRHSRKIIRCCLQVTFCDWLSHGRQNIFISYWTPNK